MMMLIIIHRGWDATSHDEEAKRIRHEVGRGPMARGHKLQKEKW